MHVCLSAGLLTELWVGGWIAMKCEESIDYGPEKAA